MKRALRFLGSAALVGLLAWRLDWRQLGGALAGFDLEYGLLALAVYVAAQLVSSLRWRLLAAPLGLEAPWRRLVALYFVGMFFNLALPTSVGGDVARAWYLGGGRRRFAPAFLSVLAERGSGLALLVVLACASALLAPAALPGWMGAVVAALGGGLLLGVAALPLLPRLTRLPVVGRKLRLPAEAARTYLARPGLLALVSLLSLAVQMASVATYALVARGLGLEVAPGYLAVAVPLLSLLTLAPVSVNGMGLREVGLAVLLAPAGVPAAQAVTLSLVQFAVCVAASLAGGVVYLAGPYARPPSRLEDAQEGRDDADAVGGDPDQGRARQPASAA